MKLKPGDMITLKETQMAHKDKTRVVLGVLEGGITWEGGVLINYYPGGVSRSPLITVAFTPFSNIEEPPKPKAVPGRTYRHKLTRRAYVCRESGRLARSQFLTIPVEDRDFDPDEFEEVATR